MFHCRSPLTYLDGYPQGYPETTHLLLVAGDQMGNVEQMAQCLQSSFHCIVVPLPLPCWSDLAVSCRRYAIAPPAAPPAPEEEESDLASAVSAVAAAAAAAAAAADACGCRCSSEHDEARRRAKTRVMMQKQRIASQYLLC